MADTRLDQLQEITANDLTGDDLLLILDVGANLSKKVSVTNFANKITNAIVADGNIPSSKVANLNGTVNTAAIANSAVTTDKLASAAVTGTKLANNSAVVTGTSLPAAGSYTGQIFVNTSDNKSSYWNGSAWLDLKAKGSVNTVTGNTAGIVNIVASASNDSITLTPSLDNTSAANQFLAGPTGGSGAPTYRTIDPSDLPVAGSSLRGAVVVSGGGLTMNSGTIAINNSVSAQASPVFHKVAYNAQGLVTSSSAVVNADLPVATSLVPGAVQPGTGLSVTPSGVVNHSNTVVAGTKSGITYDAQGHITAATALIETDIPNLSATKITTGTLSANLFGTNSITGAKLANYSTVRFGGAGSTSGVVTFPTPEFAGQMFFDASNGDLYLYDGNTWQPITVISGDLVYAGTYNAATNLVKSVTTQGSAAGLVVGAVLPAASATNIRYYVVVSDSGTGVSPAPAVALAPPDMIISNGATWDLVDVSNAIAGQIAANISFTPYGNLAANNVQTALQELDDEKLSTEGGTVTGELLIGTTGALAFEGSTSDVYETYLTVVNPTADRTITLPDASGTVVLSGAIVNADISASAAIADTKLATISTAGKVSNSATTATNANTANAIVARDASGNFSAGTISATFSGNGASLTSLTAGNLSGTIPTGVLGNSSLFVGTTSVALNRGSANQALTGISSIALPGATSGTITVTPAATAGTTAITLPATTGTLITTGDTGTVTGTMIADGTILNAEIASNAAIVDTKLATISTAGKVANSATTATNLNTASAIVARDASGNFSAGTISAALTGNASTATALATARTIQGVSFDGTANITVVTAGSGISVTGTAVANTGVLSVNGGTGAITNVAVTNTAQSFSAAQRGTVSAQGSVSGTVTLDFATANNFSMTLPAGGSVTLANPSNLTAGQSGSIVITQNGTTAATVAYGSNWKFSGGTPTMSTGLSSVSTLVYYVESATRITAQLLTNVA